MHRSLILKPRSFSTDEEGTIPRFFIHTLGCKVNRAESETIAAALLANGLEQADRAEEGDVLILNTCTVTGEADTKNRKTIRSLLRKSSAPLLVTGCAINIDADFYADINEHIVCESDKSAVPQRALELTRALRPSDASSKAHEIVDETDMLDARVRNAESFRTRVDLKIQDGCDNACSYCIVQTARGPARSVPAKRVLKEARALASTGTPELVLVGIDLAAYRDEESSEGRTDLASLTELLLEHTDIGRVRISSVEPQSITPSLIDAFARSDGRLCRHLHVCLQSGCDKTLHEMNRNYNVKRFRNIVDMLRAAAPTIALSTDVIVGFPGETDEDFEQSRSIIEKVGFMRLHVFRYSKRPGTPAAKRADQVDPKVKAARSDALLHLNDELMLADMQRRIGTTEQIVIERPGMGTSESFHVVACDENIPVGTLASVELYDLDVRNKRLIVR